MKNKKAYTLIECLVSMAVIAILVVCMTSFIDRLEKAGVRTTHFTECELTSLSLIDEFRSIQTESDLAEFEKKYEKLFNNDRLKTQDFPLISIEDNYEGEYAKSSDEAGRVVMLTIQRALTNSRNLKVVTIIN